MQYGIQKVLTMRGYDIVTDEPKITLKFLKDTTLTNGQETSALTQNGTPLTHFDHSQSLEISGTSSVIDDGLLALQTGSPVEILTNTTEIRISEILTVNTNSATTTYTPTGVANSQLKFIEVLDSSGNVVETFTQMASAPTTKKFSVAAKVITFFASDLVNGTKVRVHYYPTAASARKISQLGNKGSATLRWECEAVFKDACSSQEKLGLILIPKGHVSGAFEWSLSEGGEPAVHNFSLVAEKTCLEKLWDVYIYDSATLT